MGKRKISILEPAATSVAEIAFFIESEGLPQTAKKFVNKAFAFFAKFPTISYNISPALMNPGKI